MSDLGQAIGGAFEGMARFILFSVCVLLPLALWKLWDIGWWMWEHVTVSW